MAEEKEKAFDPGSVLDELTENIIKDFLGDESKKDNASTSQKEEAKQEEELEKTKTEEGEKGEPPEEEEKKKTEEKGEGEEEKEEEREEEEKEEGEKKEEEKPSTLKEIPVKINGKEGVAKIDFENDKVVIELEGEAPKEMDIQTFIQKGIASDERFREASKMYKEVEEKIKEYEEKEAELLAIKEQLPELAADDKLIAFAYSLGIDIPQEIIDEYNEARESGDEDAETVAVLKMVDVITDALDEKHEDILREAMKYDRDLINIKLTEIVDNSKYIKKIDGLGENKIGTASLLGILTNIVTYMEQTQGKKLRAKDVLPMIENVVKEYEEKLEKIIKDEAVNVALEDKEIAGKIVDSVKEKHPDIYEKIKKEIIKEYKQSLQKGQKSASPSSSGGRPPKMSAEDLKPEDFATGRALEILTEQIKEQFLKEGGE